MAAGEEKEFNLTLPNEYHAAELAGAEVVFKVKVHEIKAKVLPEIDDELAKDVNIERVETLEQLQGQTLEAVVIATRTARAVKALAKAGKVSIDDFPLLMHVDGLLNEHATLNIPWKKFERHM